MASQGTNPDPALANTSDATKPPTTLPTDPEMPANAASANGASLKLPSSPDTRNLLSKADEILERLSKLIKTTAGLGSLLSTVSYSLYILAYLDINAPSRAQIVAALSRLIGRTPSTTASGANTAALPVSRFAPWIALINDTRFALRLTGLLPMYMLLKSTLAKPHKDFYLRTLSQVQVGCYLTFQLFENLWFLSNKNLLPATTVNRLGGSANLLKLSCRPWFAAITCDFLRLYREAQLEAEAKKNGEKQISTQEQKIKDEQWYSQLFVACSWYPMAVHYSKDGGIGLNTGMVGLCGMLAGMGNVKKLWAATKA